MLVSFVETPELTRYDYARQQRLMWPDSENHPSTVSNAHPNVTVYQPFRNLSTGHKLRVVMQNRYSPCNRNLPDFAYPQVKERALGQSEAVLPVRAVLIRS